MRRILLAIAGLALSLDAGAQSWDRFPQLPPGRQAAVKTDLDGPQYDELRRCLRSLRSAVGARYYAAVVEVSAANGEASPRFSNAVPYVDALYQSWRPSGRLDPDTHVLMAMSIANRGIAIHPGIRWADLGFEGDAITRTIDGSRFGELARGGDYGRALCALAADVDRRLAELDASQRRRRDETRTELAEWQERADRLEAELADLDAAYPALVTALHRELEQAGHSISSGRSALSRGRFREARSALELAAAEIPALEVEVRGAREARDGLPELVDDIARRRRDLDATPGSDGSLFDDARALLQRCDSLATEVEVTLLEGRPATLTDTRKCLESYARELKITSDAHYLVAKVVPRSFAAVAVLVVALLVFLRLRRRRRARKRMDEEIARWKSRLETVAERLFELEERYAIYFVAGSRQWSGDSESLDQRCADAVNQLFLLYSKAVDLHERAQREAADASRGFSLSAKAFERLWELLRSSPVRLETSEVEQRRRIDMALSQSYEGSALTLLDDVDAIYGEAAALLAEVDAIESRLRDASQAAGDAAAEAIAECTRRGDLGLPTAPLLDALAPIQDLRRRGDGLLGDPVQAVEVLIEARAQLEKLTARARLGNEVVEKLRGAVTETGRKLRAEVERLREAGFRLEEPGFQPDVELDRGVRRAGEAEQLVAAGEESRADELLQALEADLDALAQELEAVETARDRLLPALADSEAAAAEIRSRLPGARTILERLHGEHSADSFRDAADNLEELEPLLAEVERWGDRIRQDHERQHYLAALAALEECRTLVGAGSELVDEIERAETALNESRERTRALAAESRDLLAEIERLGRTPGAGRELTRSTSERAAETRELLERVGEARPDWPQLEERLGEARGDLESLAASVREELEAFRRSQELARELEQRHRSLAQRVGEERRDRPHVGQAVADAGEQLAAWRAQLEDAELGGRELLAAGRSLTASLGHAEQAWKSEMDLVRAAEAELRAAQAEARRLDGRSFGYGVVAHGGIARLSVTRAERARDRRQWDEVLAEARQARREVHDEETRCAQQARALEAEARRRAERLRRQRQFERALQTAVVLGTSSGRRSSRGSSRGPSFGSSFSSRGGGRSSGPSFGGTRSGGSSW